MEMDKYISADEMVNVCFVTSVNSDVGFCPHLQNLLLNLTAIFQAPELFTTGCATQLHLCNSEDKEGIDKYISAIAFVISHMAVCQ